MRPLPIFGKLCGEEECSLLRRERPAIMLYRGRQRLFRDFFNPAADHAIFRSRHSRIVFILANVAPFDQKCCPAHLPVSTHLRQFQPVPMNRCCPTRSLERLIQISFSAHLGAARPMRKTLIGTTKRRCGRLRYAAYVSRKDRHNDTLVIDAICCACFKQTIYILPEKPIG